MAPAQLPNPFPDPLPDRPASIRLRRILLANHFSDSSDAALVYAAALAQRFGAEILAEHVIPPEEYERIAPGDLEETLARMKESATVHSREVLARARLGNVPLSLRMENGDIPAAIAESARRNHVDMIATGSHGRHGIQKLLSAAVDEEIAIEAQCPVLLIGPEVVVAPDTEAHIRRILCATNLEPRSRPALEYAYGLAQACGAALWLMHTVDNAWREPLSTRMTSEAFCRMRLLESALPARAEGVDLRFIVEFGIHESLILDAARRHDAQLLVVGLRRMTHPGLASHLPGPLAYNIASHAPCPVLAVRDTADHTS